MLDGASRLDEMVAKAVEDGQPAIGMTDHGNMYGTLDFYKECNSQGIKPIIGTEAYMAHDHRSERPSRRGRVDDSGGETEGGKKLYYHLILLAENNEGYKNLIQLSSLAFMEGYYYKPRMDWELLEKYSERADRHHRVPRWARAAVAAERRREGRTREGRSAAGHLRTRQLLHRDPGPRHPRAGRDQPEAARDRQEDQGARCSPPTTATTPTSTTTLHTTRCCACRPGRSCRTRSGSSSRAPTTT